MIAQQWDRVVGPRHPALVTVGAAMAAARALAAELAGMGHVVALENLEVIVKKRGRRGGGAEAGQPEPNAPAGAGPAAAGGVRTSPPAATASALRLTN
jgi:hypothetical protein